jgi:hypothetical protein
MHIFEFRVYFLCALSEILRLVLTSCEGSCKSALEGLLPRDVASDHLRTNDIPTSQNAIRIGAKAFARICEYRCLFMQAFAGITQASEYACSCGDPAMPGAMN